ncbi:MAG: 4'-phosphopantetheinyl transferase superfamily protein [Burkholderiales bacterium]|nr:4'-phosphopantetheinyl transferase superfamily protein [Burkholderiales bacterium]
MSEAQVQDALKDTVHVWLAYPEKISLERLSARYLSVLDAEEKERFHRFHFDPDRHHYLAAHVLLRLTLSRYAPLPPSEWRFVRGSHGKPAIAPDSNLPPLCFNLSHTKGLVACVISLDRECGIDVETIRPMRDMQGVAQTVFSPSEIAWLNSHAEADLPRKFFSLWTLKEAYIKAIGLGFSAPVPKISFDMTALRLEIGYPATHDRASWFFHLQQATAMHSLALASRGTEPASPIVCRELILSD